MSFGKLLKNAIRDILRWATDSEPVKAREDISSQIQGCYGNQLVSKNSGNSLPTTFRFTVTNAVGGKVVTVMHYDPNTDRHHENVYIITEKEDLGEELGQIITRESLTR